MRVFFGGLIPSELFVSGFRCDQRTRKIFIRTSFQRRVFRKNCYSRLNTLHIFHPCATAITPKQIIKTQLYLLSCAHWRPHGQGLKYLQRESKIWSREKSRRKTKRVPTSIHRMKKPRRARCGNAEEKPQPYG